MCPNSQSKQTIEVSDGRRHRTRPNTFTKTKRNNIARVAVKLRSS